MLALLFNQYIVYRIHAGFPPELLAIPPASATFQIAAGFESPTPLHHGGLWPQRVAHAAGSGVLGTRNYFGRAREAGGRQNERTRPAAAEVDQSSA
jgi:hypothetical protein